MDCIAQDCILFSKLLEVSKVFLSFTYIFKTKLLCTQDFTSHKKRRGKISNWDAIAYHENINSGKVVKLEVKFQAEKNTLTVDADDQQFNSRIQLPINIHKQAVKKKEPRRIRKTSQRTKATRALFTHHRVFNCHLFTQTSFHILDLTEKGHGLLFKFNYRTANFWTFLLRFWHKVSAKPYQRMQISWRVFNCSCILNLHSSGISRTN